MITLKLLFTSLDILSEMISCQIMRYRIGGVFEQISKMELFVKIVNGFQTFAIFTKVSVVDVLQGSEDASVNIGNISSDYDPKIYFFTQVNQKNIGKTIQQQKRLPKESSQCLRED